MFNAEPAAAVIEFGKWPTLVTTGMSCGCIVARRWRTRLFTCTNLYFKSYSSNWQADQSVFLCAFMPVRFCQVECNFSSSTHGGVAGVVFCCCCCLLKSKQVRFLLLFNALFCIRRAKLLFRLLCDAAATIIARPTEARAWMVVVHR